MKKQVLKDCIYKTRVEKHEEVKRVILNYIEDAPFLAKNSYIVIPTRTWTPDNI